MEIQISTDHVGREAADEIHQRGCYVGSMLSDYRPEGGIEEAEPYASHDKQILL